MRPVFVFCLLACLLFKNNCDAAIIKISPSPNSIKNAVEKAKPGDTIILQRGIYKEHDIFINKRLTIIGDHYPVIEAELKYEGFSIAADSVSISNLQIQNTARSSMKDIAGIKILNAGFVVIRNNKLINNTYGVYLQNAKQCQILNNIIHATAEDELNSGNGIHGWKSNNLEIRGNSITGHRDGLYFEFVTDSKIQGNASYGNVRYGLHFMFSHNNLYRKNIFKENGSGVAVMYSRGIVMLENAFVHNWGDASYGVLLKEISDSRMELNSFVKNTVGVYMEGASRIMLLHNTFRDNGWAIRIQANCNENSFLENNCLNNSFDVSTNGTMVLNTFKRNYWDKYEGYDMNKDNIGDVPYYPVSLYSVVAEKIPIVMILYRSLLSNIMDKAEVLMPSLIPDKLKDEEPVMKQWNL